MSIKKSWKRFGGDFAQFGREMKDGRIEGRTLGKIGKDFGKAMVLSVTKGAEKAANWAERENTAAEGQQAEAEKSAEAPAEEEMREVTPTEITTPEK